MAQVSTRLRDAKLRKQWNDDSVDFQKVNKEDADSITAVLNREEYDLVVHTAGPFQGKETATNGVLEACVNSKVPYVDVCDDYCTAMAAKAKYTAQAEVNGVPCIVSTGCWPGVSSLMAKQLIRKVLKEDSSLKPEDLSVDFSFFTAGSGGAGATLLVATFLILAEEALTIVNGRRRPVKAMKEYEVCLVWRYCRQKGSSESQPSRDCEYTRYSWCRQCQELCLELLRAFGILF